MKKIVIVSLHIGYWLLYLLLLLLIMMCLSIGTNLKTQIFFTDYRFEIFLSAFTIIPAILGFYSFYVLLFDKFLIRKNILLLFIFGILASIFISFISAAIISALHTIGMGPGVFHEGLRTAVPVMIVIAIIAVLNGGMGLLTKGFIRWYSELKLKEELAQKNFEMELALIKSQINPHFLFNTLNNIDVLISKDADRASLYLNKLSDIMRFMLYETKTDKIPLSKELNYIEKYIELQKIRTSNPDFVDYTITGEENNSQIPPMIFIPFIENAFKHTDNIRNGAGIRIRITIDKNTIIFNCENKYHESDTKEEFSGLGNELIMKRLILLYPDRHTLLINKNSDIYSVKLQIDLNEN